MPANKGARMSSCPGSTLEDFLMWDFDLIVDGNGGANPSLQIAEAVGVQTRRRRLTAEQFAPIVTLFEPHREQVEYKLGSYDEDENGSWRDYAGYAFDFVPRTLYDQGLALIDHTGQQMQPTAMPARK
jgi:hypothetical protein